MATPVIYQVGEETSPAAMSILSPHEEKDSPSSLSRQYIYKLIAIYNAISSDPILAEKLKSMANNVVSNAKENCCETVDCCRSIDPDVIALAKVEVLALRTYLENNCVEPTNTSNHDKILDDPKLSLKKGAYEESNLNCKPSPVSSSFIENSSSNLSMTLSPKPKLKLRLKESICPRKLIDDNVRIYADGVFDLIHSGHFNALRQVKLLGGKLIVGINGDTEVFKAKKCLPIYTNAERAEIIGECKWVDEVVVNTPYDVSTSFLDSVNCSYAAHGDDIATGQDGSNCYAEPMAAGRLLTFDRTEGISTTSLISRLLFVTQDLGLPVVVDSPTTFSKFVQNCIDPDSKDNDEADLKKFMHSQSSLCMRQMMLSTKRLQQFIGEVKTRSLNDIVVYVDGSFDVFHTGHIRILKKAKSLGTHLIVGIHDDVTVRKVKGERFPIMSMLERALNVLAMRVVDEVIFNAPWNVTEYLINSYDIDIVVRGSVVDSVKSNFRKDRETNVEEPHKGDDPYQVPKYLGIYRELESSSTLTTSEIIQRIVKNRNSLLSSITKRSVKEESFWRTKDEKVALIA